MLGGYILDNYLLRHLLFQSVVTGLYCSLEMGGLAQQRNNQSKFSFKLEEVSRKLEGISEPLKETKPD